MCLGSMIWSLQKLGPGEVNAQNYTLGWRVWEQEFWRVKA
jgi:hypothetical protein